MKDKKFVSLSILFALYCLSPGAFASKILVFGDFGSGSADQAYTAEQMVEYCEIKGCDFGLTTGDNIYPHGVGNLKNGQPDYDLITKIFVNNYKELKIPIYISYGNHDIGNEGIISIFKDILKNSAELNQRTVTLMTNQLNYTHHTDNPIVSNQSRLWTFPAPFYQSSEKNASFWAIDTNTYPHRALDENNKLINANPKNSSQAQWLEQSLSANKSPWKIVYGHMPLFSHGNHGWKDAGQIKEFRKSIIDSLCKHRVDFYLAGHDHHLEVDKHICPNGHVLTAVLSGAAGKTDRVYQRSFPLFTDDKNLIWANGKHYKNNKLIYKNDDNVMGFSHIDLQDNNKAVLTMKLSKGFLARERTDACFQINKGQAPAEIACNK